jgi:hypothetical protein
MVILYERKQKTGRKICDLLKEAVHIAYGERDTDESTM